MKKMLIALGFAALLFVSLTAGSVYGQDLDKIKYPKLNKLEMPDIEKVTLPNGIRLYLVEDHSLPIFRTSVRVNAGEYLEPADKVGLVDLLGTVLRTGGTQKWTGDQLDEILESVGASVETGSGVLACNASVNVLSDQIDLGLEVLSQVLRYPVFDQEKIDLAKVSERTGISRRNDEPLDICIREFRNAIYGPESPYARHTEYATVDAIEREDLLAFHDSYFRPNNIQMAIWGDYDKKAIVEKIKQYFGDWQPGTEEVPPPPDVEYTYDNRVHYAEKTDVNQANILMGHIGGYVTDPDFADKTVMNNVLGGGVLGGRMFNRVRSKEGLAYAAQANYNSNINYPGFFYTYVATRSESAVKAIRKSLEVIESMQTEKPTDDEMDKAKSSYLNSFVFNFDSKAEVVNRMMNYDFNGLPEDFLQQQKEKIEKVSAENVLAAAQKNLHPEQMHILVVGNQADFDEPLEALAYGPVDTIDITIPSGEVKRELSITPENIERGAGLMSRMIAAQGGLEAFKKISATHIKATLTLIMQGRELPLQIDSYEVMPDNQHMVISIMGQKMYDIRKGDSGWKTDQMTGGVTAKTAEDIANDKISDRRSTLAIIQQADNPSYQAVYDGTDEINGVQVELVALVDDAGDVICRLGINPTTGELLGKMYWGETMLGEGNVMEVYSEPKTVNGVTLPMHSESSLNGQVYSKQTVTVYEVNPTIPEGTFEKPTM